jgi:hypothetical protein
MSDDRLLHFALAAFSATTGAWAMSGLLGSRQPEPLVWHQLHFGRDVDEAGVQSALRSLASDHRKYAVCFEAVGANGAVHFRIGLPKSHAFELSARMTSFVPELVIERISSSGTPALTSAWRISVSTTQRPLCTDDAESVSRSILSSLSSTGPGESVMLQWLIGPRLRPSSARRNQMKPAESWGDVLRAAAVGQPVLDHDERKELNLKQGEPGFRTVGRIAVTAKTPASEQTLVLRLVAALRMAEGSGVRIGIEKEKVGAVAQASFPRRFPLPLNVSEVATLLGWPLGSSQLPGMNRDGSRLLRPADTVTGEGRVIGKSAFPGDQRHLVLPVQSALQHLHVLGPTGVGKSTLLLGLITQDIADGRNVVVIDPKGDLIEEVLERVPRQRQGDVVVLDPTDESSPVGLNVLATNGRSPELVADQVLAVFHGLYKDSWGPRTQDILHASLLTLAGREGVTLCNLPLLLSHDAYRREMTARLTDEIALRPFWHWFERISEAERLTATAPIMNKLRAFLLRPRMRAVLGQTEPRFNISEVFGGNKILLVSLAKGTLGPEAAALLGSLVVSQIWQTTLGRVAVPSSSRAPVMTYIDEFQDYLHLPTDLADVLAQARGLGLGLTLAHQHLGQLPPSMRDAVLANARSRVCFQLAPSDAKTMSSSSSLLTPDDFLGLPRFHAYASLVSAGGVTPPASIRTLPPGSVLQPAEVVQSISRQKYGRSIDSIEAELRGLLNREGSSDAASGFGKRRTS